MTKEMQITSNKNLYDNFSNCRKKTPFFYENKLSLYS